VDLDGFRGVIAATITPNGVGGDIVEDYLRFLYEEGVRGVFVLGTMGEGAKLPVQKRKGVAERIVGAAGEKFLRIIHVGVADTDSAMELARHAGEAGADAVSAIAPFFYRYDAESLAAYYSSLAASTMKPVLIYNNPARQGYTLNFSDLARIFELATGVRGIKDTSGDPDILLELQDTFGVSHFIACGGDNLVYYAFNIGVRAHVSSLSSVYPELVVGIMRAVERGDHAGALRIQLALNRLRRLLKSVGPDLASYRYALTCRGFDLGPPLPPTRELSWEEKREISSRLEPFERLAREVGGRA